MSASTATAWLSPRPSRADVGAFVVRRVAHAGVIAVLVATLTFFLIHLAPGDPFAEVYANPDVPAETVGQLRVQYGLDRGVLEQWGRYLGNAARLDLGYSIRYQRPVVDVIAEALPYTLLLMGTALSVSLLLGVALGALQAARAGSFADRATRWFTLFFHSLPDFWLALVLMLVFGYWLRVLPSSGVAPAWVVYDSAWDRLVQQARHLVLPALTLVLLMTAVVARHQRTALLEALPEDYVRTARAKGVPFSRILMRHALRNAILPIITLFGLAIPMLLGGAVFVERVFGWPGMGRLVFEAIGTRDYFLLTACVFIGGLLVVMGSLVADVLSAMADPRQREG